MKKIYIVGKKKSILTGDHCDVCLKNSLFFDCNS